MVENNHKGREKIQRRRGRGRAFLHGAGEGLPENLTLSTEAEGRERRSQ